MLGGPIQRVYGTNWRAGGWLHLRFRLLPPEAGSMHRLQLPRWGRFFKRAGLASCRAALFGTGFQRRSLDGSHSNPALAFSAFGGWSFLRNGRAERHSAVQRIPRSHSTASLRSRSAVALSSVARASLRYRIARALLMASQIPTQQNEDSSTGKKIWLRAARWGH